MITELIRAVITLTGNCEQQIKSPWLLLHTGYVAIENVNTIDERRSFDFDLIWFFTSHQQSFSYIGTGLPGMNQY